MSASRPAFVNTGHRGAMGLEPENTLRSFRRAVADGANEIELDVRLSRDGIVVVMHDATVDRTTDGTGAVADLTLAELRELDAGLGERVPTFGEVLDEVDVPIQTEIKSVDAIGPLLELMDRRPKLRDRLTLCSFHGDVLEMVARRSTGVATGQISSLASAATLDRATAVGARRVLFGWEGLDEGLVARAHERGILLGGWPADSAEGFARAFALDLDGVTTNYPHLYQSDAVSAGCHPR